MESDARGIIRACPSCGQRNRLLFERLGQAFRCAKCQTEFPRVGEPIDISSASQFDALIAKSSLPVLADFWAPWCGPCKMVAPHLVKVANDGAGKWIVAKVNTEALPELGARFNVRSIPTLALFQDGKEIRRQAGAMPAPGILQFLQQSA